MAKLQKDIDEGKAYLKEQLTNNKYVKNVKKQNILLRKQNAALVKRIAQNMKRG